MVEKILKLENIGLAKLSNAEYLALMIRLDEEMSKASLKNIGITQEYATAFRDNIKLLSDVSAQNNANTDTTSLQELDQQRDIVWQHIMRAIKNAEKSPISTERQASQILIPELKPYSNKINIPHEQETQLIRSFLLDMDKPANKPHLLALNLLPAIEELNRMNEDFASLYGKRVLDQLDKLPNSKTLRKTIDEQYNFITQKAYGMNIAIPTTESTAFIVNMNIFIKAANDAYVFRMAHTTKKTEDNTSKTES